MREGSKKDGKRVLGRDVEGKIREGKGGECS